MKNFTSILDKESECDSYIELFKELENGHTMNSLDTIIPQKDSLGTPLNIYLISERLNNNVSCYHQRIAFAKKVLKYLKMKKSTFTLDKCIKDLQDTINRNGHHLQ